MAGKWKPPKKTKSKPPRYLCRGGPNDATHLNMKHEGELSFKLAFDKKGRQSRVVVRSGEPLERVPFDGGTYVLVGDEYHWSPDAG